MHSATLLTVTSRGHRGSQLLTRNSSSTVLITTWGLSQSGELVASQNLLFYPCWRKEEMRQWSPVFTQKIHFPLLCVGKPLPCTCVFLLLPDPWHIKSVFFHRCWETIYAGTTKTRFVRDWSHHVSIESAGMTLVSHMSQDISILTFSCALFPKCPNFLCLSN